jgi:hypothetical protein
VEALGAVARRTLPKNPIRLLPVQDRKDEGSGDLLTRSLVHASDRTGVATAAATGYVLVWPAGCLYNPVQPISYLDHDLN